MPLAAATLSATLFFGVSALASAQALTLADVKARNATRLDAHELKQLMPRAKVVDRTPGGSTRRWENKTDGTLAALSDTVARVGRLRPSSGNGTWRVTDEGTYCVSIDWYVRSEQWCRYIFRAGNNYYGVSKLEDSAPAHAFSFSK